MAQLLASLAIGTLFGAGIAVSEMIDPARVIGFLDMAGRRDPTLAFVMIGALAVTIPAFALARRQGVTQALGSGFSIPAADGIDGGLILGSAIFGIGWGFRAFARDRPLRPFIRGCGPSSPLEFRC